jgi:hypothetical protein
VAVLVAGAAFVRDGTGDLVPVAPWPADITGITIGGVRFVGPTDPATPVDEQDPVPPEEETEDAEVGAWMGEKEPEPSETPDPEWQ